MQNKEPKVFVVDGDLQYYRMFKDEGWRVVGAMDEADMIQFTGGADVSPALYNQHEHPRTGAWPDRDKREQLIFRWAIEHAIPMAGICRGGQFLNVMCGGSMWQDVNNHATGGLHLAVDKRWPDLQFYVTSTHHQMMVPGPQAEIVLTAAECTLRERCSPLSQVQIIEQAPGNGEDIEAVFYKQEDAFCFQPHPEYRLSAPKLAKFYFDYIDEFFQFRA